MYARLISVFSLLFLLGTAQAGELEQAQFVQVITSFNKHYDLGQYKDAIPYGERAVTLATNIYGPNAPEVVVLMTNLVNCHLLTGEWRKAIEVANEALAKIKASGGGNDILAVRTLFLLGRAYGGAEPSKAKDALMRALSIQEASYGKNDPRLADVLRELGNNAMGSRFPLQGRRFFERAVDVTANASPEFAESRAMSLFELGRFEMATANYRAAEKCFLDVLRVRAGQPPSDHLQLMARSFLIELYDRMDEPDKATEHVHYLATLQPEAEFNESRTLLKVVPAYPFAAKPQDGEVMIGATIDETGRVINARVVESDLSTDFENAALKSVSRWRYKPLVVDGKFMRREDVRIRVLFTKR